ncbi:PocR ligand-binding domain-containing protein [Geomesophilobacter sediminis]|uniref:histidine kinase n=1 Tax=Geomesophilobacter sediminis TaxID=2798584 RepID=A0A8J7LV75_9BACT|nr:PocR ligand-binding domain-containing protein [Geomesophilobacter sediminis]MBJ6725459.1 PocR ligand-binding domain-containing protein [Geomesophilobacter sediminis]
MSRFAKLPISIQLLAIAILLTLPAAGIILYSGLRERHESYHTAEIETQRLADNIAAKQESLIVEAQLLGSLLADLPEVKQRNKEKVESLLTSIHKKNQQYQSILVADETGRIWASSIPGLEQTSIAERRYFKAARETLRFSSGEFALHKVLHTPTVSFGYPLTHNGKGFRGTVIMSYDLEIMRSILQRSQLPRDTNYVLIDHQGVALSRGNGAGQVGKPIVPWTWTAVKDGPERGTGELVRSDGEKRISSYRKLRLPGEATPYMYVIAGMSLKTAVAHENRKLVRNITMLAPFAAGGFFLALFIGRRSISERIYKLQTASKQLAAGDLTTRVGHLVEGGELGELGRVFDDMASRLNENMIAIRRSEDALRETEQRLRNILEYSTNLFYVQTPDQHFSYISPQSQQFFDCAPDQVLDLWTKLLTDNPVNRRGLELTRRAIETGERQPTYQMECVGKRGRKIWVEVNEAPILEEGKTVALVGSLTDITERKEAEDRLQVAMQRLQLATTSGRLGVWDWNLVDDSMVWDDRMLELYGISRETFTGSVYSWLVGLHPDDMGRAVAECSAAVAGEKPFDTTFRVRGSDGTERYLKADGIVIRDAEGKPVRMIGINRDISEQKRMEEALQHRLVALTSPLGILGDIKFQDLFNLDEIQQIQDAFAAAVGVASLITDVEGNPITRPSNFSHLCELIIRNTPKGLANCYKSDAAIGRMNPDGPIIQPCLSGGLLDGGTSIQVGNQHVANWLIGQVLDESCDLDVMMAYAREIEADEREYRQALRKVTRMSREQFERIGHALYLIANQLSRQALQNVQQAKYITERMRAEAALRESEQLFKVLAAATFEGIVIIEAGVITEVNEQFGRMLGYDRNELVGLTVDVLIPVDQQEMVQAILLQGAEFKLEHALIRRDASRIIVESHGWQSTYRDRSVVITAVRDLTETRQAEEERLNLQRQLMQAQKMESLGVLAGGIAHDFNNILTAILGNTELALMQLDEGAPIEPYLKRVNLSAQRAADLARQMLAYSGKGTFSVETIDLNRVVEEMQRLIHSSITKKAELRLDFTRPLPAVEGDATQLRQVILNLVINASEAIGEEVGTITIRTGWKQCDRYYLRGAWLSDEIAEGRYVFLEVQDTGCGMDKETQEKVFDPFFTTKFTGRGLGMSAVQGIIRSHHGSIQIYSEPGQGSVFRVLLPATDAEVESAPAKQQDVTHYRGSGTVLLVDDEEPVRDIGRSLLEHLGFSVITANDGAEALAEYRVHPEIAFVILDLTMPRMDGAQCQRELVALDPEVKVIISSGFSTQEVGRVFAGQRLAGIIMKPYTMSVLCEVLVKSGMLVPPSP